MESTIKTQLNAWRERSSALKNLPPVLLLIWQSAPFLATANVTLRVATALMPLAMLWISQLIVDGVNAALRNPGRIPEQIWWLLGAEFVLAGLSSGFSRAVDYCNARLADEFSREVSLRIMRHAATLDLQSFEDPVFYDKLERARVQAIDRVILIDAVGRLLQQIVTLVSLSAAVIKFSPLLFVLLVVCVVPAFLGESHFAFLGYALAYRLTPVKRELDYLRVLGTSKESAKEMKVFGLAPYLRRRFADLMGQVISQNRGLLRRRLRWGTVLTVFGSIGYYGAYAYVVYRTLNGGLTIGGLIFMAGALQGSSNQIQLIFSTFSGIADQALFLTDLLHFFGVRPTIQSRPNALPAPRPIRDGFEFRKVCFHYPGTSRLVLENLDFRISPGERVALVGENGQGKTTFVKLMARLYDPTSGQILLDGVDLREYDLEDLQREIGVIFQDFVRYDMTARENIGVGLLELMNDSDRLLEAAHKSKANEILNRLPRHFDQMLGRRFEGGVDLSGGEWQKFALARAYLRNAQVLILDEPTAALDAMAEYEVFCRFSELTRDRMAILISHRFSTVRMADRIVVLAGGAIREQGTHRELVARGGRYAEMFELQAANYR